MKKTVLSFVLTFVTITTFAQDLIIKKDSSIINAKITEVKNGTIKYKNANYIDGPTFQIYKYKLNSIIYGNGDTTVFKHYQFQLPEILTERKGLYLGLNFAPGLNTVLKSNSDPAFTAVSNINIKYYFTNNFGIRTAIAFQEAENDTGLFSEESDEPSLCGNTRIGIPIHFLYTTGKRIGLNVELGGTYYYPFNYEIKQTKINLKGNYVFTAEAIIGLNYRLSSQLNLNAGALIQYDILNYTEQKNSSNLFTGLQIGIDYRLGK